MALHPQARRALEQAADDLPVHDPSFDVRAARAANRALALEEAREEVAGAEDVDADGVACRLYTPLPADGAPAAPGVLVHLHGGGFVMNDVDVHDAAARRLANRAGVAVLSVDYRRPPEHPFPAAPDDVDTALGWLGREAGERGLAGPVYAHGDSAGANLALVAALRHPGRFAALALTYPFLDPEAAHASYASESDGLDARTAAWYWAQYAARPEDLTDPDLAPLRSGRLHTLPPTLVVTAEHDPLRGEGEDLAARLAELGVHVVGTRYLGQIHGFWRHADVFDAAEALTGQVASFLRAHAG